MSWTFSVVEIYLLLGFIYELMTWLFGSVFDIPLWWFILRYSMHV